MEEAVVEMKYDAKKAPLGKLTSEQVKAGYAALKKIESIVLGSGKPSNKDLLEACNAFYTRVPHYFGMKVPPLIRTRQEIQDKLTLLQALGDIQAAMNIINQPLLDGIHPVDQHYEGLKCDMNPLNKEDSLYQTLEKYLLTTHGKTHSMYKIKILDIFEANKSSEESRFKDVGNRMLLWHGSRLTNWAGILSQGLRIAPPEAPSTGYMFGKGIYFADMASKSANYCMPSYQNKTGILVLCDVSLGKCRELLDADYKADKLPSGYHSVKGLGKTAPDLKNSVTLSDGVVVPLGPGVDTKIQNKSGYTLQYNEYIVYDVSQVKIKYLFKIEFDFK
ncbi:Poly [ADP-ribose] polymerase 2 [Armadillidium vulgare]|nr:Poly [ADP-ribose] polymerase 2 [Armadillidium vulgare]